MTRIRIKEILFTSLCALSIAFPSACFAEVSSSAIFTLTNADRISAGVAPLSENTLLDQAAQMKAEDMLAKGYFAHLSPEGYPFTHWIDMVGYHYRNFGENLSMSSSMTNEDVNNGWMSSVGHRANILNTEFTEIGVGVATGEYQGQQMTFVAQEFGAPKIPSP
ncbi:MAG: CAP domain-containing protein, partial [Minisyncoccia bacterium]